MGGSAKIPLNLVLASALAVALALGGPAAAEGEQPEDGSARVQGYSMDLPQTRLQPVRVESLLGREVKTRDEDPGRIVDVLADGDGRVRAAVVELGGFLGIGTRKIAVDWSMLRFDSADKRQGVVIDVTRDQLRLAPEYKASEPVYMRRAGDW
jgi:PRC-barrel domain